MCFIYWKYSGEIYEASLSSKSLDDFFGINSKEASKIFDCIICEYNQFQFYNFKEFNIVNDNLKLKNTSKLKSLL